MQTTKGWRKMADKLYDDARDWREQGSDLIAAAEAIERAIASAEAAHDEQMRKLYSA